MLNGCTGPYDFQARAYLKSSLPQNFSFKKFSYIKVYQPSALLILNAKEFPLCELTLR